MKLLIVDDETLARERLRRLCEESGLALQVTGEAADGASAVQMAAELHPDVVLLDVRMPGMDGIEAARHLSRLESPPAIIFTTAYDEYALEAFDVHAIGYLLKPVRKEKLAETLQLAQRLNPGQLLAIGRDAHAPAARQYISARVRGNVVLVPVSEVLYFQADQKYITVRHLHGEVLIEESLKDLEQEFGDRFVRIHRNALVALSAIAALERDALGRTVVAFRNGISDRLEISRRHLPDVRARVKHL